MSKSNQEQGNKYSWIISVGAILAPFFTFSHLFTGNNLYKIKTDKGSTIKFKKEDVRCDIKRIRLTSVGLNLNRDGTPPSQYKKGNWTYYADCTANGIKTNLVGNEYVYNGEERCNSRTKKEITCRAAVYFGRFNYDQVD